MVDLETNNFNKIVENEGSLGEFSKALSDAQGESTPFPTSVRENFAPNSGITTLGRHPMGGYSTRLGDKGTNRSRQALVNDEETRC